MQQSRVVELVIRLLAAFSEAIIVYMVYLFINYFWFYSITGVGLITTIAVSIGSVSFCLLASSKRFPDAIRHIVIGAAGLVISVGIIAGGGLKGLSIITSLALLLLVWLRGVRYANVDSKDIYSMDQFGYGLLILLAMNFLVDILVDIKSFSSTISQCSVLYAIIGIFILTKCKELQFCHLEYRKRNGRADIAASIGLLIVIILLSSRNVMEWCMHCLYLAGSVLFELLYRIMFIVGYAAYRVFLMLIEMVRRRGIPPGQGGVKVDEVKEYGVFVQKPWIELLLKASVYLIIAAAAMLVLAYIRRLLEKSASRSTEADYTEEREFIIGTGSLKNRIKKALKGIAGVIEGLGSLKQTNREKIRNEYKRFLSLLSRNSMIGSNETAERVGNWLSAKYPQVQLEIQSITGMYEKVRYGGFEPDNEEVRRFKAGIVNIRSSITAP